MGAETPDQRQNDAWRLLDWCFANFRSLKILEKDECVGQARVLKGRTDTVGFMPERPVAVTLTKADKGEVRRTIVLDQVVAPVKKGDVIGSVQVEVDGRVMATVPLVAAEDVARASFLDYALRYLRAFTIGR